MKICENCGNEHNGEYGSGRFCSIKCSRGFSTKAKRKEINGKVSKSLKKEPYEIICKNCGKIFYKKRKHIKFCSVSCSSSFHMKDKSEFYSELAKQTGLGGNRNNYAHGWYDSPFAGNVYLESSYEYKVAKELDENKINWIRPAPLNWDDKKYYPDFYLVEENVYLDPKNDFLILRDKEKINKVQIQNKVNVIILDKNELTWIDIKNKIAGIV